MILGGEVSMAAITVGDETLDVEIIAMDTDPQFYIRVEFQDTTGAHRRNEWQLDVDKRSDLTVDWIEQTLSEWTARRDDVASLVSFSIQRVDVARRGANIDTDSATSPTDDQPIDPATATSDLPYAKGDRVAYYVDGPDSAVYGYTTDAIVTELPPIHKQHREPLQGKVEIDTGVDTKLIPTDWVVGPAADVDIDRPNEKI